MTKWVDLADKKSLKQFKEALFLWCCRILLFDKEGFVRAGLALINYEDSFLSPTAVELLQYAASLQMNDLRVECAA
mgnify:CR=1 FL=1